MISLFHLLLTTAPKSKRRHSRRLADEKRRSCEIKRQENRADQ